MFCSILALLYLIKLNAETIFFALNFYKKFVASNEFKLNINFQIILENLVSGIPVLRFVKASSIKFSDFLHVI